MSIKKVTLASLILLSLTACSSGGSGGGSSAAATKAETKNQQSAQQQTAQQKAQADAEAKRLAAEKAAKEKAEAERLAAEKAAKEKAEAERLAAEKAAKEKAEAERLAAEKAVKEKAEAERLAAEKAEIDSYKSFMHPINNNFNSWANPTFTRFELPENAELGLSRNIKQTVHQEVKNDVETDATYTRQYDLYNQKHSIVLGELKKYHNPKNDYGFEVNSEVYSIIGTSGLKTDPVALPKEGSATYSGKAFNLNEEGILNYTVNFASKEGYGKIEGMPELGTIELEKGSIVKKVSSNQLEISSNVSLNDWKEHQVSGTYDLVFYGKDANEVAGNISLRQEHSIYNPVTGEIDSVSKSLPNNSQSIGFGGTRGDIQP